MRSAGNFSPEWGYLAPAPSFARTARVVLVATAIGATAGAGVVLSLIDRPSEPERTPVAARAIVTSVRTAAGPSVSPAASVAAAPTAAAPIASAPIPSTNPAQSAAAKTGAPVGGVSANPASPAPAQATSGGSATTRSATAGDVTAAVTASTPAPASDNGAPPSEP